MSLTINQLIQKTIAHFLIEHDTHWLEQFAESKVTELETKYASELPDWSKISSLSFLKDGSANAQNLKTELNQLLLERVQDIIKFKRDNHIFSLHATQNHPLDVGGQVGELIYPQTKVYNYLNNGELVYWVRLYDSAQKTATETADGDCETWVELYIECRIGELECLTARINLDAIFRDNFNQLTELKDTMKGEAITFEDVFQLECIETNLLKLSDIEPLEKSQYIGDENTFMVFNNDAIINNEKARPILKWFLAKTHEIILGKHTPIGKIEVEYIGD